jgi:hypothetical protein
VHFKLASICLPKNDRETFELPLRLLQNTLAQPDEIWLAPDFSLNKTTYRVFLSVRP